MNLPKRVKTILSTLKLACVASVSVRVRQESWEESKKRNDGGGERGNSNFRAIACVESVSNRVTLKL